MPTQITPGEAERAAQEILNDWWTEEDGTARLPVDPIAIAHRLEIKVFTATMEPDISGMLFVKPGQDPEIYLNSADGYNRQRFTCAHEIGHWQRRVAAGEESFEVVDYRGRLSSAGTDPAEIYANRFAASLLMPEYEIRRLASIGYGAVAIAERLRVSLDAAAFRLQNLGLA